MATSIIAAIDSSLRDLSNPSPYEEKMRVLLRNLKIGVLCLTKFGNNAHLRSSHLESLLLRIQDVVGKIADWTKLGPESKGVSMNESQIESLIREVGEGYTTLSQHHMGKSSSSLTASEVVEITDSIRECKEEILRWKIFLHRNSMQALEEELEFQITFSTNSLLFATQSGVGHSQLENLLIHFEDVAVETARLCIIVVVTKWSEEEKVRVKCSMILKRIKPVDPQVYQAYAQVLSSSKLSRQRRDDDTMKNLLDSLISLLWEVLLQLDDFRHLACMKDQLQAVYEGLRFSRTVMKRRPKNSDEKIMDQIGILVCDAGLLICSFHQPNVEIDLPRQLSDLLERIDVIRAEVEEKVEQKSAFINFPKTIDQLGYVDSIVENLTEYLKSCHAQPIAWILPQTMQEELVFLRSFLGEIVELRNGREELQTLWTRVLEVAYRVERLVDHLVAGDISSSVSNLSDSIREDIRAIKIDALKISYEDGKDILSQKVIETSNHQLPQSTPSQTNQVVGFHDDATSIVNRLTRGSNQLRIVAIYGMAGSGKTTLALNVYNHPSVTHHFHVRAWWPISQVLDKRKVLLELLNQLDHNRGCSGMTEFDLAENLFRSLKGKRYLIFLDDVWTIEAWNSLGMSFPDDSKQSRIILTSRQRNIALHSMLDKEPHLLLPLSNHESLDLLQQKLFSGKGWPPTLNELGMQIAVSCKGLPLTIVIVAGLLATMKQEGWKEILDALSSGVVSSTEQCMNTLELSYKNLPDYLKHCFLYFGAFPEDEEVSVKKLIRLWIAEGFVRKSNLKRIEDVAEEYMVDLTERSLVMVTKQKSIGGAKAFRIHDLLHDFCLRKAKQESFFHLLQGKDQLEDFNEPCFLRRLYIQSDPMHFMESKLFCPRAHSLLFFNTQEFDTSNLRWFTISFIVHIFKLLEVLDIEQIDLSEGLPTEIGFLVQLKYLSIKGNLTVIPSLIGKLSNLETFIVFATGRKVRLPHTFWNLQKLKYLCIPHGIYVGDILHIENLESSSILFELTSFSRMCIYSHDLEMQMRKFPNIRRLKCILPDARGKFDKIVVPDFLSRLESLNMEGDARYPSNREFGLPVNLRKLTLSGLRLSRKEISIIGKLPNLEVLKLLKKSILGDTLEMEEGEFSKLKFLKLSDLSIFKWIASDEQFPYLQKLVMSGCDLLEEIPTCLESISSLEVIGVYNCSRVVESLIEQVEEQQRDLGNSVIKIHIHTSLL